MNCTNHINNQIKMKCVKFNINLTVMNYVTERFSNVLYMRSGVAGSGRVNVVSKMISSPKMYLLFRKTCRNKFVEFFFFKWNRKFRPHPEIIFSDTPLYVHTTKVNSMSEA